MKLVLCSVRVNRELAAEGLVSQPRQSQQAITYLHSIFTATEVAALLTCELSQCALSSRTQLYYQGKAVAPTAPEAKLERM